MRFLVAISLLLGSGAALGGDTDVTLFAPAVNKSIIIKDADPGRWAVPSGSRDEYFHVDLKPPYATTRKCVMQRQWKELLVYQHPPDYQKVYLWNSVSGGTDSTNDFCMVFHYAREVHPRKLLELFGLTYEKVGAEDEGGNHAVVIMSRPKNPDDPLRIRIGRASLELTITESPKIIVKLLGVDPTGKR